MSVKAKRIEGWKSIALHFKRDRTTVMRWARDRGLPIHRLPGGGSSSIFAYTDELDKWLARFGADEDQPFDGAAAPAPNPVPDPLPDKIPEPVANAAPLPAPSVPPPPTPSTTLEQRSTEPTPAVALAPRKRSRLIWAGIGAVVAVAGMATQLSAVRAPAPEQGSPQASPSSMVPADPALAAIYIQARNDWALRTSDGLHRAFAGFGQVVSRDPQFAPGYAGLADAYLLMREFDALPDAKAYPQAEAAAKAALAIDPNAADPYRALGFINYWWHNNHVAARTHFAKSLALDPKNAQTHFWYGNCLMYNGETVAGLSHLNTARLLNPDSLAIKADYGWALWLNGQRDEGKAVLQALGVKEPALVGPHTYLAYIYLIEGDGAAYLREAAQRAAERDDPAMQASQQQLQLAFNAGGFRGLIAALMRTAAEDRAQGQDESSAVMARWAAATGHRAELITILTDSDARKQMWSLGGFLPIALTRWQTDPVLSPLLANRRGEPLALR